MADVDAYRWIVDDTQSYLAVAACVTIVRGLDVAGAVLAFGDGSDPDRLLPQMAICPWRAAWAPSLPAWPWPSG